MLAERLGDVAGALGRLDGRDVERREMLRQRGHRLGKGLAAVNGGEDAREHFATIAAFLLGQGLQRFDEVQPRLEERQELHREQRRREAGPALGQRQPEPEGGDGNDA
jgi:hypothetical protein